MFFSDVFNAKVVDYQGEADGAGDVFPQARSVGYFIVSMWGESFLEEGIGYGASAGESVDGVSDLQVHEAVLDMLSEVVLFDDMLGEDGDWHFHVLKSF